MSVSKEFLLSVYERCNEHLKEQSTKRDQTIAFYLVVLSFYFGSYSTIKGLLVSQWSLIFFNIVMIILSGLSIRTLVGLRSWHIQYANGSLVISKILANEITEKDAITEYISSFFKSSEDEYKERKLSKFFEGIENRVILGITFISGFPVVMLVKEIVLFSGGSSVFIWLGGIILYFSYIFYYFYILINCLRCASDKITWVVNFE